MYTWADDENPDGLKATWTDNETVTVDGRGPARTTRTHRTYTMDGTTTLGAGDRLRTVLTLGDQAAVTEEWGGRRTEWSLLDDRYTGDAMYTRTSQVAEKVLRRAPRRSISIGPDRGSHRRYGSDQ